MTFSMNRSVVSSLVQWFGVCHMSKPSGNVCEGWHLSVFLGIGFAVKVESVPASVTVTWHLSLRPAISTLSAPSCSRVQFDEH